MGVEFPDSLMSAHTPPTTDQSIKDQNFNNVQSKPPTANENNMEKTALEVDRDAEALIHTLNEYSKIWLTQTTSEKQALKVVYALLLSDKTISPVTVQRYYQLASLDVRDSFVYHNYLEKGYITLNMHGFPELTRLGFNQVFASHIVEDGLLGGYGEEFEYDEKVNDPSFLDTDEKYDGNVLVPPPIGSLNNDLSELLLSAGEEEKLDEYLSEECTDELVVSTQYEIMQPVESVKPREDRRTYAQVASGLARGVVDLVWRGRPRRPRASRVFDYNGFAARWVPVLAAATQRSLRSLPQMNADLCGSDRVVVPHNDYKNALDKLSACGDLKSNSEDLSCRPPTEYDAPQNVVLKNEQGEETAGPVVVIDQYRLRTIVPEMKTYTFPKAAFLDITPSINEAGRLSAGIMFEVEGRFSVSLPRSVVDECRAFLSYKSQDFKLETLAVLKEKTVSLCRQLWFATSESHANAILFCPYAAYFLKFRQRDSALKFLSGAHVSKRGWKTSLAIAGLAASVLPSCVAASPVAVVGSGALVGMSAGAVAAIAAGAAVIGTATFAAGLTYNYFQQKLITVGVPTTFLPNRNAEFKGLPTKPESKVVRLFSNPKKSDDKTGNTIAVTGLGAANYVPCVYAANANNELCALEKRVLATTPEPTVLLEECITWATANSNWLFGPGFKLEPLAFPKWVAGVNSSKAVRDNLQAAKNFCDSEGITQDVPMNAEWLYKATTRKSFIKTETTLTVNAADDARKAPRLIQGAKEEMSIFTGPWMTAFQGLIKQRWGKKFPVMFASGQSNLHTAQFLVANGTANLGDDDIGSFDASIGEQWCKFEVFLANRFKAPKLVMDLMKANINTHGVTQNGWKYQCKGTRKSGDAWTTVMNSIINAVCHLFILHLEFGWGEREFRQNLRMVVAGDDNAFNYKAERRVDFSKYMAELGFEAKPSYKQHVWELEFCSCRLWPVTINQELTYCFVPKIGKALTKVGFTLKAKNQKDAMEIARGAALSMLSGASSSPPLKAYLERVLELTSTVTARRVADEPWKMSTSYAGKDNEQTWLAMDQLYGWTHECQAMWEDWLKTVTNLGVLVKHDLMDMLLDKDTGATPRLMANNAVTNLPVGQTNISNRLAEVDALLAALENSDTAGPVDEQWLDAQLAADGNSVAYDWSITSEERNRLQHASNGNPPKPKDTIKVTVVEKGKSTNSQGNKKNGGGKKKRSNRTGANDKAPSLSVAKSEMNSAGKRPGGMKNTQTFTASDYWQTIEAGSYNSGTVILNTPVTISQMGDWLKSQSQLWEQWRIKKLTMKFNTAVPSTQPGNVVMAFDPDPLNDWSAVPVGSDAVKRIFTYKGKKDFSLWQQASCDHPGTDWLFTQPNGSDPRLYTAGSFVFMAVSGFVSASDLGALHIEWTVEFRNQCYNQSAITETAFVSSITTPWNFSGKASGLSCAAPEIGGNTNNVNLQTEYYDIGVPVGYAGVDQGYHLRGVNSVFDYGTQITRGLCLPAGEYMINVTGSTSGGPPASTIGFFMEPAIRPGSQDVNIIDYSAGLVNISNNNGGAGLVAADVGFEGCMIVEVKDDCDNPGISIDLANDGQLTVNQNATVPNLQPVTARKQSNDWGWVDWVMNYDQLLGGSGLLKGFGEFVVDLATSALPLLLFERSRDNPRLRTMLLRRRSGKELRSVVAGGFSPQEKQFISMLQSNPNWMVAMKASLEAGSLTRPVVNAASEPNSGVLVAKPAWFRN